MGFAVTALAALSPATIGTAALATAGVGAGLSAYGTYEQGQAESQAAAYQAQVAQNNQLIANQNAQYALEQGQQQVAAKQQQTAQLIGTQRAAVASSGIDPNSGSAVRLQSDSAGLGALDASQISNNAARTAYGYQTQGMDFAAQASLLQSQSSNAAASGELGAFNSIVGGASSVASKWLTGNLQGLWPSYQSYQTSNGSGAQLTF